MITISCFTSRKKRVTARQRGASTCSAVSPAKRTEACSAGSVLRLEVPCQSHLGVFGVTPCHSWFLARVFTKRRSRSRGSPPRSCCRQLTG